MKSSIKKKIGQQVTLITWEEDGEVFSEKVTENGDIREMTVEEDHLGTYSILWVVSRDEAGNEIGRRNVLYLNYIRFL